MEVCFTYTIKLDEDSDGGFVVTVPALPGCYTQGSNYDDALANAKDAIQGYIEAMRKMGRVVPVEGDHPRKLHLQVHVPTMA